MRIVEEKRLRDFQFWDGALETAKKLTNEEFDLVEEVLEELYPNGLEDVKINDIFWFDEDFIWETIGRNPYDEE